MRSCAAERRRSGAVRTEDLAAPPPAAPAARPVQSPKESNMGPKETTRSAFGRPVASPPASGDKLGQQAKHNAKPLFAVVC